MSRNSNRTIKALLMLSALCLSASAQPQTITGKVVGVSDGNRADRRQPQQLDLSPAELPGLLEGRGAQPRAVQDGGRRAGGWVQEGAKLSAVEQGSDDDSDGKS
jgi:hypothetical protein